MRKYTEFDELTSTIIGCAIEVHRHLGPGQHESIYQTCLIYELEEKGLILQSEISLPIFYNRFNIEGGFRIGIHVENAIVLELKTVEFFASEQYAQFLTYMVLGNQPVGYLLNFHVYMLKEGIRHCIL